MGPPGCEKEPHEEDAARRWTSAQGEACLGMLPHAAALQELRLQGCQLTALPDHLPYTLQVLNLADNRLRSVGGAPLTRLSNLRHLDLSKNLLRSIGDSLKGLVALESLVLDANELGMGGSSGLGEGALALPQPESLHSLSLCGCAYKNHLPGLPAELWKLRGLEELNLNYCGLDSFGEDDSSCAGEAAEGRLLPVKVLPRLRRLDLVGNRLASLGATSVLWNCIELRVLVLTDNNLSTIDRRILCLTKLERLFLRFNRLSQGSLPFALPPAPSTLPQLHELDVRDNLTLFSSATMVEDAAAIAHWESCKATSGEEDASDIGGVRVAAERSARRLWYTPVRSPDGPADAAGNSSVSLHRSGPAVAPPRLTSGAQPSLDSQLAPLGTSVLRDRLATLFGVCLDPLTSARPDVLARLCTEYAAAAAVGDDGGDFAGCVDNIGSNDFQTDDSGMEPTTWRVVRRVDGTPVPAALLTPLREALERTQFPNRRQRAGLQAGGYFVLAPPGSSSICNGARDGVGEAAPEGSKLYNEHDVRHQQQDKNRGKLLPKRKLTSAQKKVAKQQALHGDLWRAAAAVLDAADAVYARQPFHVAVTKNFSGSPHIDRFDSTFQYAISVGDFRGGGELCVEENDGRGVALVRTQNRMACIDGRFPHWVAGYDHGDDDHDDARARYSVVFYVTDRSCYTPKTIAVLPSPVFEVTTIA